MLRASTADSTWVVVMKKDNFAENDVSMISKETKLFDRKPERCLLISLSDLDENAKIKALQERFWVWNEHEVNTLLTLFDKPNISK